MPLVIESQCSSHSASVNLSSVKAMVVNGVCSAPRLALPHMKDSLASFGKALLTCQRPYSSKKKMSLALLPAVLQVKGSTVTP